MHELTVTESILEIVVRHGEQAGAQSITDIHLSEGTIAEGAALHFNRIQTEMECLECQKRYQPSQGDLSCPACTSRKVKIISGEEFFVDSIEVEMDESAQKQASGET